MDSLPPLGVKSEQQPATILVRCSSSTEALLVGVFVYNRLMRVERLHMITLPKHRNTDGAVPKGLFDATYNQMLLVFGDPSYDGGVQRWIRDIDTVQVVIYETQAEREPDEVVEWRVEGTADNCLQLVTESIAERPI